MADAIFDGRFAERGHRPLAWHGIIDLLIKPDEHMGVEEGMNKIGLLYNFDKQPVAFKHPVTGEWTEINDLVAVLREPTGSHIDYDFISAVKPEYGIIQHRDIARALDRRLDVNTPALSERFPLETLGALHNGEVMFLTLKGGDEYQIAGDPSSINRYFLVTESKRGDGALVWMPTDVRVVCQNTLTLAMNGKQQKTSFKHTKSIKDQFDNYTGLLNQLLAQQNTLRESLEKLAAVKLNQEQLDSIVQAAYADPTTSQALRIEAMANKVQLAKIGIAEVLEFNAEAQRLEALRIRQARFRAECSALIVKYNDEMPALANTAYVAIQAISEFSDNRLAGKDKQATALDVIQGHRAGERNRAMSAALAFCN